ncbi:MAG: hypothetical protein AAGJ46_12315 [Planctomycetota bacterium]
MGAKRNTFEKTQRELKKKRKAEDKLQRRLARKDAPTDSAGYIKTVEMIDGELLETPPQPGSPSND